MHVNVLLHACQFVTYDGRMYQNTHIVRVCVCVCVCVCVRVCQYIYMQILRIHMNVCMYKQQRRRMSSTHGALRMRGAPPIRSNEWEKLSQGKHVIQARLVVLTPPPRGFFLP